MAARLEEWMTSREVSYDEAEQKEIFDRFAPWIQETTRQIRSFVETNRNQTDNSSPRLTNDIWFELAPTKYLTVPSVDGQCRAALTLPSLRGQSVQVRLKRISRYALLANWIGIVPDSESGQLSRTMDFAPYYARDMEPELHIPAVGYPLDDRVFFSLTYPANVRESAVNDLARTRTGCRGMELLPFHRLIDEEDGSDKTLEEILKRLFPVANLEPSEVLSPKLLDNIQRSLDIPVFSNELFEHTVYQHYYNEYALVGETLYDAVFENPDVIQPINSDNLTYFRRQPSVITARQVPAGNLYSAIKNPRLGCSDMKGRYSSEQLSPWVVEGGNQTCGGLGNTDEDSRLILNAIPGEIVRLSQRLTAQEDGFKCLKPGKSYCVRAKFEPPKQAETVQFRLSPGVGEHQFVVDSNYHEFRFDFEAPDPGFDITLEMLWAPQTHGGSKTPRTLEPLEIRLEEVGHMRLHLLQHKDLLDPLSPSEAEASEPDWNIFPATPLPYPGGDSYQFEAKQIPDMAVAYSILYRDPEASAASGNTNWFLHLADVYMPWHPAHQTRGETSGTLSEPLVVRRDAQLDLRVFRVDQTLEDDIPVDTQENASVLFQRVDLGDLRTRYAIDMEMRWRNGRPWDNANLFYMVERNHRYYGPVKADTVSSHLTVHTFFTS